MNESRERGGEQQAELPPGTPRPYPGSDPVPGAGPEHAPDLAWDEDVTERLLDGEPVTTSDPHLTGLARLLAAATRGRPVRPEDERAVLAAFRASRAGRATGTVPDGSAPEPAHTDPGYASVPPVSQVPPIPSPPVPAATSGRRRLPRTAKALVGGFAAAFALGGVAIAAQTGNLPHPFDGGGGHHSPAPSPSSSPTGKSAPRMKGGGGPGRPGAGPDRDPSGTTSPPAHALPHSSGSTHGQGTVKELCDSYTEALRHGRQPAASVRARLAVVAGGSANVAAYCAGETGTNPHPSASPSASPAYGDGSGHGRSSAAPTPEAGLPTSGATAGWGPQTSPPAAALPAAPQGSLAGVPAGPDNPSDPGSPLRR